MRARRLLCLRQSRSRPGNPLSLAWIASHPLARLQAETVFIALIQRLSVPKLEVEPTYLTDAFRALKSLPITFSGVGARLSRIAA